MEFKGTKGKWQVKDEIMINDFGVKYMVIDFIGIGHELCVDVYADENQDETNLTANALLISKAPEMLEMLKIVTMTPAYEYAKAEYGSDERHWTNKIEELIKEATEI